MTMAMMMRLVGGKISGDGNVRVVGKEEGKGRKVMVIATRMAGK